eukprot:gnl/Hemi2/8213_TR2825_c0_g11_i1.p1 gnl/Hemi2/8213_TR2825_c0_g11~~gnl/Hemi2/8213_TR2825_c0_g11_i1.p1  ORF type:complete len:454 (-),score=178.84 gnl/Hemi2/8213_TR2825_c0_g11_i1:236-1597(-)
MMPAGSKPTTPAPQKISPLRVLLLPLQFLGSTLGGFLFLVFAVLFLGISCFLAFVGSLWAACWGNYPFYWATVKHLAKKTFTSALVEEERDVKRTVKEIIENKGYPCEEHTCVTEDGFVLRMQRIPHGINSDSRAHVKRPVALLHHGLTQTAGVWVMNSAQESLAFILADAGYDVWLGNSRGNCYSNGHVSRDAANYDWNWTFEEMGKFDLAAEFDYILNKTRVPKLVYVGHSMGTSLMFAGLAMRPELADKVSLYVAMSPAAYLQSCSKATAWLCSVNPDMFYKLVGRNDCMPITLAMVWRNIIGAAPFSFLALLIFYVIFGWTDHNMHPERIPVIFSHTPNRCSSKTVHHFLQCVGTGEFKRYDYGEANMQVYKQPTPPHYNLSSIRCPIAVFYGLKDDILNMDKLFAAIPKPVFTQCIDNYHHVDYMWGRETHKTVYPHLLTLLKQHSVV